MFAFTATRLQVATYLFGVCPFSIAFLVFLNSSVSFVITDLIGRQHGVGDAVGNLGFADELIALVACPAWGLLSDKVGVRTVCAIGYTIICMALILFVQAKNVYPQLLLARLFFSIGGAAASTMVTAVLPAMSYKSAANRGVVDLDRSSHAQTPSITSELTITPARFQSNSQGPTLIPKTAPETEQSRSTSQVAGLVGMFTGLGALLALFVFLPLPAFFQKRHVTPAHALQFSYYIVAGLALLLALACLVGLRNLASEEKKHWIDNPKSRHEGSRSGRALAKVRTTAKILQRAVMAGFHQPDIGIGYLGGFVARASSVGISLFIPFLVNHLFATSGLCKDVGAAKNPVGLPDIKRKCPRAYIVAAEMTGASQMVALLAAPLFGYWSAKTSRKGLPLAAAAVAGIIGYPTFVAYFDPDDTKKGARAVAFVAVSLIGFSQIGAIVCSLVSLSTGILKEDEVIIEPPAAIDAQDHASTQEDEHESLLIRSESKGSLAEVKGSVAGVYSFFGGAAILILTKAGGALFDSVSVGAPFYIMASFNAILLVSCQVVGILRRS